MFRFTIRELVLLTLVAAMGVGWWLHSQQKQTEYRKLEYAAGDLQFRAAALLGLTMSCGCTVEVKPFSLEAKKIKPDAKGPNVLRTATDPHRYIRI